MDRDIAALVPHQGTMCLLDSVEQYDEQSVVCRATSHRLPNHPLRDGSGLRALCAIEYGAQAIAAHACLLGGEGNGPSRLGVLASVRDVVISVPHLDNLSDPLIIRAELIAAQGDGRLYDVTVTAGRDCVLTGRLMVKIYGAADSDIFAVPQEGQVW